MSRRELKRIALLLPNTDTTLETDLQISLPSDVILHTARMRLDEVGEEAEKRMVDEELPEAIASLENITRFDGAVFGCTSASAVYGEEGLQRIRELMENRLHCPATSAFEAVLDEVRRAGAKKIGLLTPYTREVNTFFAGTLTRFGVACGVCYGLDISDDTQIARVEPQEILEMARIHQRSLGEQDLILISCTNFRASEVHNAIERMLGIPVVNSNQAIVRWILSRV